MITIVYWSVVVIDRYDNMMVFPGFSNVSYFTGFDWF
jgi:hypothetical protein